MSDFDLDDIWETIRYGPRRRDEPVELSDQKIAAALLPLFLEYIDFDQQESGSQHRRYLMLGWLKRLAEKGDNNGQK